MKNDYKILKWYFIIIAIISFVQIILTLIIGEVTIGDYIYSNVQNIVSSILFVFILDYVKL